MTAQISATDASVKAEQMFVSYGDEWIEVSAGGSEITATLTLELVGTPQNGHLLARILANDAVPLGGYEVTLYAKAWASQVLPGAVAGQLGTAITDAAGEARFYGNEFIGAAKPRLSLTGLVAGVYAASSGAPLNVASEDLIVNGEAIVLVSAQAAMMYFVGATNTADVGLPIPDYGFVPHVWTNLPITYSENNTYVTVTKYDFSTLEGIATGWSGTVSHWECSAIRVGGAPNLFAWLPTPLAGADKTTAEIQLQTGIAAGVPYPLDIAAWTQGWGISSHIGGPGGFPVTGDFETSGLVSPLYFYIESCVGDPAVVVSQIELIKESDTTLLVTGVPGTPALLKYQSPVIGDASMQPTGTSATKTLDANGEARFTPDDFLYALGYGPLGAALQIPLWKVPVLMGGTYYVAGQDRVEAVLKIAGPAWAAAPANVQQGTIDRATNLLVLLSEAPLVGSAATNIRSVNQLWPTGTTSLSVPISLDLEWQSTGVLDRAVVFYDDPLTGAYTEPWRLFSYTYQPANTTGVPWATDETVILTAGDPGYTEMADGYAFASYQWSLDAGKGISGGRRPANPPSGAGWGLEGSLCGALLLSGFTMVEPL